MVYIYDDDDDDDDSINSPIDSFKLASFCFSALFANNLSLLVI